MIQRIQTLFLIAILVLSGLMFTGDLVKMDNGTGTVFTISFAGLGEKGGEIIQHLWPLTSDSGHCTAAGADCNISF